MAKHPGNTVLMGIWPGLYKKYVKSWKTQNAGMQSTGFTVSRTKLITVSSCLKLLKILCNRTAINISITVTSFIKNLIPWTLQCNTYFLSV
jgi:hypothetical protein